MRTDVSKVSVIIPVYNAEAHLPHCLESVLQQAMRELEIILVDDGSTDGSGRICDAAARQDPRIQVLHQENLGSTEARKAGLRVARSSYVTFVDADDWVEPDLCAALYEVATANGAELVVGAHFQDIDGQPRHQKSSLRAGFYDRARIKREILPVLFHNDFHNEWSIYPYMWGKLFLREKVLAWQEQVDAGIGLGDDVCVTFPYVVNCESLFIVEKPLYHYVQHAVSQFHASLCENDLGSFRKIWQIVSASFAGQVQEQSLREQLRCYLLTCILLPRSSWLLPDLAGRKSLFPFQSVPRGSKVVLYGAGIMGMALHDFLERSHFAEVILWLDARAPQLRDSGYPVQALSELAVWPEYDYALVAIMNARTAAAIRRDLLAVGVPQGKIRCLDEKNLQSEQVWQLFGMEDEI